MKKVIFILLSLTLILISSSCDETKYSNMIIPFENYFDTTGYVIFEYDTKDKDILSKREVLSNKITSLLDDLEYTFAGNASSISNSLCNTVNSKAGANEYITVNSDFMNVVKASCEISTKYSKFDITIGPLTSLWDISNQSRMLVDETYVFHKPSDSEINNALLNVGYEHISIRNDSELCLDSIGCELDFGAIAKGYAVDKLKTLLINEGFSFFVVNFGGNVYVNGISNNSTSQLPVGVKVSAFDNDNLITVYHTNTSIVTSGINNRYITVDNVKFSHILDITTGYPVSNKIESVTIINPSSMFSDAFATLVLLSGVDDGIDIMKENNLMGIIVTNDKDIYIVGNVQYILNDTNYEIIKR